MLGEPAVTQAGVVTKVCRGRSRSYTTAENQHMEGLRLSEHCLQGNSSMEGSERKKLQMVNIRFTWTSMCGSMYRAWVLMYQAGIANSHKVKGCGYLFFFFDRQTAHTVTDSQVQYCGVDKRKSQGPESRATAGVRRIARWETSEGQRDLKADSNLPCIIIHSNNFPFSFLRHSMHLSID